VTRGRAETRKPRVVAVVVTRDRPALLRLSLDALRSQTIPLQAVVVVDNASGPETVRLLRREPGLTVVRLKENTGGSGGFAVGVERALALRPDWVWLLDDDVVVAEDALERLLAAPEGLDRAAPDLGVVCSAVEEGGRLALLHRRYFDPSTLRERVVPREAYRRAAVEIDIASFVGFLARAEAIRRVGLPDARFFLAYDDTEYSLRLKRAGYRLWLVPSSRAQHRRDLGARLRHGPFGQKHYYNLRNRFIVYRKFGSAPAWRWVGPLLQGVALLLVAGRGRPLAFRWWWRAMCDGRAEPYVVRAGAAGSDAPDPPPFADDRRLDWM
jgi:GT2 family glycosyltransferase